MPLDQPALEKALRELFEDAATGRSVAPLASVMGVGWGEAMKSHAKAIVPASTTVASAAADLGKALAGFGVPGAAAQVLESAFATFGNEVGGGMKPAFNPTPPSTPVGFAQLFAQTFGTAADAARQLSIKIDSWMRKGKAKNVNTGLEVPWS